MQRGFVCLCYTVVHSGGLEARRNQIDTISSTMTSNIDTAVTIKLYCELRRAAERGAGEQRFGLFATNSRSRGPDHTWHQPSVYSSVVLGGLSWCWCRITRKWTFLGIGRHAYVFIHDTAVYMTTRRSFALPLGFAYNTQSQHSVESATPT